MTKLEKFVEDLKYRGYRNVKIEGDKLVTNSGTTHIDQHQPTSEVNVIVHAVDDVVETFTMSDIHVTLNLSLPEQGTTVEKYHFERNGKTLEITRDEISASEAHDRLQYVFDQLKQL